MSVEKVANEAQRTDVSHNTAAELTKAFAWPVTIVLLVICFWTPLHLAVGTVPLLLSNSEEIAIGGATFHMRKTLINQASGELKEILNNLGPGEIGIMLDVRP